MPTDRSVLVRLKANPSDFVRGFAVARAAVHDLTKEIDTTNDRTAWLAQSILALGPAMVPIGAAAVPVFAGLATQLTVAGSAAVTAGLAFHGVGDALTALNNYQLDPTDAHLAKLSDTMAKIGPDGQRFVQFLDSLGPAMTELSNTARGGLFPGVEAGITDLMRLLPQVERIVGQTASTLGDLASAGGAGLAGPRFAEFFEFLETDAQPILLDMGRTIGNIVDGLAAMIVRFAPLSAEFSAGFAEMSKSFADWAHGLEDSASFQDFVDYIHEAGPRVRDLLGAIAEAVVEILKAAAPVGDLMLPAFTELFKIIAAIADTPLGPVFIGAAAAVGIYGRAVALASITTGGFGKRLIGIPGGLKAQGTAVAVAGGQMQLYGSRMDKLTKLVDHHAGTQTKVNRGIGNFARAAGPAAATAGLLALNVSGAGSAMGLTNTATLALMGTFAGPWGAAIGAGIGVVADLSNALATSDADVRRFQETLLAKAGPDPAEQLKAVNAELERQRELTNAPGPDFHVLGTHVAPVAFDNEWRDADAKVKGLTETQKELEHQIELGEIATEGAADAQERYAGTATIGLDAATKAAERFTKSLEKINAVLTGRSTFRDYEQAVDDFTARKKKRADLQKELDKAIADAEATGAKSPALQHRIDEAEAKVRDADTAKERKDAKGDLQAILDQAASTSTEAHERALQRVKDLREELKNYKLTLDTTTQAGRDTQASIDAIAKSAVAYAETIKDPVLRTAFLDNARDQYIKASLDAGASKKAAADFAKQVGLLNGVKGKVIITVDADGAIHIISELDRRLRKMQRKLGQVQRDKNRDDLDDRSYAGGGWTGPGGKYTPAGVVHANEFVFSSEATDGNVQYLSALHQELRGYASGGHVTAAPMRAPVIDLEALRQIARSMQPLYGPVSMQPHNYSEFKREMEKDMRLAGIGGPPE